MPPRINLQLVQIETRLHVLQRILKQCGDEATGKESIKELKEKIMTKVVVNKPKLALKPVSKPAPEPQEQAETLTHEDVSNIVETLMDEKFDQLFSPLLARIELLELAAMGIGDFVKVDRDGTKTLLTDEATPEVLRNWAWVFGFDNYDADAKTIKKLIQEQQKAGKEFTVIRDIGDLPEKGAKKASAPAKAAAPVIGDPPEEEDEAEAEEEAEEIDEEFINKCNWSKLVEIAEQNDIEFKDIKGQQPKVLRQRIIQAMAGGEEAEPTAEAETEEDDGVEISEGDYFSVETEDGTVFGTFTGESDEDGDPILLLDSGEQAAVPADQLTPAEKPKKKGKK